MATSSVAIPSTGRGWSGHFTMLSRAVKSRIPNRLDEARLDDAGGILYCHRTT
jgi:hypothetical protein